MILDRFAIWDRKISQIQAFFADFWAISPFSTKNVHKFIRFCPIFVDFAIFAKKKI